MASVVHGGRFDFDDGGTYCGGWEDGKAHGYGVCTGPKSLGEFTGFWQFGYEVSGVYLWPSGNRYEGQWMSGKRHGLGAERKGRWIYKGEWTQGFKGRYGVRVSEKSGARYEGTWANGLQDGYGREVYADGGTYLGQISQGLRSGYGVRQSVPYGVATRYRLKDVSESLTSIRSAVAEQDQIVSKRADRELSTNRGGFVLKTEAAENQSTLAREVREGQTPTRSRTAASCLERQSSATKSGRSLKRAILAKLRKQKSAGDAEGSFRSTSYMKESLATKLMAFRSGSGNNDSTASCGSQHSVKTCPSPTVDDYRETSPTTQVGSLSTAPNRLETTHSPTLELDLGDDNFMAVLDPNVIENYMGEWKADRRTGFGIAERSDGLRYEGEWLNNKRNGYGVTTFPDGTREEGKYKTNVLCTNRHRFKKIILMRISKVRQRALFAANNAISAAQTAQQKAEIAISRASNARAKAQAAEVSAKHSQADSDMARQRAREIAPDFRQPGLYQAYRDPIILDIDINPTSEHFNSVLQERISTTLPYPTGLDYTTGVPGVSAATLYGLAQSNIAAAATHDIVTGPDELMQHTIVQNQKSPMGIYLPPPNPVFLTGTPSNYRLSTDKGNVSNDKEQPISLTESDLGGMNAFANIANTFYDDSGHARLPVGFVPLTEGPINPSYVKRPDSHQLGFQVGSSDLKTDRNNASVTSFPQQARDCIQHSNHKQAGILSQMEREYTPFDKITEPKATLALSDFTSDAEVNHKAQQLGNGEALLRRKTYWRTRVQGPTQNVDRYTPRGYIQRPQMSIDNPPFYRDTLCEAPSPHLRRRKSLPCIVQVSPIEDEHYKHNKLSTDQDGTQNEVVSHHLQSQQNDQLDTSQVRILQNAFMTKGLLGDKRSRSLLSPDTDSDVNRRCKMEIVINDNGIRKGLMELTENIIESELPDTKRKNGRIPRKNSSEEWDDSPELPKRVILKEVRSSRRLSMPDNINQAHLQGLSRSEICLLSTKRRQELRRTKFLRENPVLHVKIIVNSFIRKHRLLICSLLILSFAGMALWIIWYNYNGDSTKALTKKSSSSVSAASLPPRHNRQPYETVNVTTTRLPEETANVSRTIYLSGNCQTCDDNDASRMDTTRQRRL